MIDKSIKIVTNEEAKKILSIYEIHNTDYLPKIINSSPIEQKNQISFEWIAGSSPAKNELDKVFYNLGKFHISNSIKSYKYGFKTVCHGDFHPANIIKCSPSNYKFIDVTYLHIGWNFSDLDYIDFLDLYDANSHPWMIKDLTTFDAYLEGAQLSYSSQTKAIIKRSISIQYLKKCIANGVLHNTDFSLEEDALKHLLPQNRY